MYIIALFLSFSVFLLLLTEYQNNRRRFKTSSIIQTAPAIAKMIASSLFVAYFYCFSPKLDLFGQSILLALVFSWLGDLLLIPKSKNQYFLLGIAAFALAHIAFSFAFLQLAISPLLLISSVMLSLIIGTFVYLWLKPHLHKQYKIMVPAYLLIIIVMLIIGISSGGSNQYYWIVAGSLLFAVSDLFVARNRFIQPAFINRLIGLPMYYLAQMMLGYGAINIITMR